VDLLRLLRRRPSVSEGEYRRIRDFVLEKGRQAPEVRQEVRALLERAVSDPAAVRAARRQGLLRRMIGTLKAMRQELAAGQLVPQKLLNEIEALVKRLEQVL
jgi:hypothetical protein